MAQPSQSLQSSEQHPLSRGTVAAMVAAVFIVNAVILGYAIYTALPRDHGGASVAAANTSDGADTQAVEEPAAVPVQNTFTPRTVADIALPSRDHVERLYLQHCAACHGLDGRGHGVAAEQLYPKPRDFVSSPFRFAPTTGGDDQIIAALEHTITEGVPRSAMPGFGGVLTESEVSGLARHVMQFHDDQVAASGQLHIDLGRHPPFTEAMAARGQELYVALGCMTCHGESGHGDGPGSKGLFDSSNQPVRPGDLASGLYKSGQTPESIARTIAAGVPGTPMVPYEQMVIAQREDGSKDATDLWALVAYIRNLSAHPPTESVASGAVIEMRSAVDSSMTTDPSHVGWIGLPEARLALRPIWQREEATTEIRVRAVYTDDEVAICLDWKDDTSDLIRDTNAFPDGVAVMFALDETVPALPMGVQMEDHQPEAPVNLWHWRADRQYDAAADGRLVATATTDVTNRRWLVFGDSSERNRMPERVDQTKAMEHVALADEPAYDTAGAVGNVHSMSESIAFPVLEANALGFGSLTLQPIAQQATRSTAVWSDGVWRVLIRRPVTTIEENDVQFDGTHRIPVSFAVWNGAKGDRAGVKLVTGWHWLTVKRDQAEVAIVNEKEQNQ